MIGTVEPTLGDHARDLALTQVLERCPDEWRKKAVLAVATLAARGRVFAAYDLTQLDVDEPANHHRWGAVINLCAKHGLIESAGYGPSPRPTVKGSAVRFWRGVA
jgi:hypothetical protein